MPVAALTDGCPRYEVDAGPARAARRSGPGAAHRGRPDGALRALLGSPAIA